jgi:hypothetical protein
MNGQLTTGGQRVFIVVSCPFIVVHCEMNLVLR